MRENSVISLEKDYEVTYQGFDPNSTESYIIFEINQNAHMEQSVEFASKVQREFVKTARRTDRGVRQAGFLVLARTSMPAILVELDFICNPTQADFLGSESGQFKLAKSLYNAFYQYKRGTDHKIAVVTDELSIDNNDLKQSNNILDTVNDSTLGHDIETIYKVQILTSSKQLNNGDSRFKGLAPISVYHENKMFKYTYGNTKTLEEAQDLLNVVKQKFNEAFIVEFINGKRIK